MHPATSSLLTRAVTAATLSVALFGALSPLAVSAGGNRCLGEPVTIRGDRGSELIRGTNGDDVIAARGGSDYVQGRGGDDLICGGTGDDHLAAGPGRDRLTAAKGDDTLVGGASTRQMSGRSGNDTFFPAGGKGGVISGSGGRDWLVFSDRPCARGVTVDLAGDAASYSRCDGGWRAGSWVVRSVERVDGSRGSDLLIGSDRKNQLLGQSGRDRLRGLGAGDYLNGGSGRDRGRGGEGADRCRSIEVRSSC